jgi:transposase-like protein
MKRRRRRVVVELSAFSGFRFPPSVIMLAVRWYLRFGLSYRDVEELRAERGVEVDHVSIYRWVQRFTSLLIDAARPCRHGVGDRWHVDETYVRVCGEWRFVYRAVDQFGQVIDVYVSPRRDAGAARRFFAKAIKATGAEPSEVVTDGAKAYPGVLDALLPGAFHNMTKHSNNKVETDHGRLKARAADANSGTGPLRPDHHSRPWVGTEPATRSLRVRSRRITEAPTGRRLRRARNSELSGYRRRSAGLRPGLASHNATVPLVPLNQIVALDRRWPPLRKGQQHLRMAAYVSDDTQH